MPSPDAYHGINANLVHKWRRDAAGEVIPATAAAFVPIQLPALTNASAPEIRIELRRGVTSMAVTWPVGAAAECAAWMRELLK